MYPQQEVVKSQEDLLSRGHLQIFLVGGEFNSDTINLNPDPIDVNPDLIAVISLVK